MRISLWGSPPACSGLGQATAQAPNLQKSNGTWVHPFSYCTSPTDSRERTEESCSCKVLLPIVPPGHLSSDGLVTVWVLAKVAQFARVCRLPSHRRSLTRGSGRSGDQDPACAGLGGAGTGGMWHVPAEEDRAPTELTGEAARGTAVRGQRRGPVPPRGGSFPAAAPPAVPRALLPSGAAARRCAGRGGAERSQRHPLSGPPQWGLRTGVRGEHPGPVRGAVQRGEPQPLPDRPARLPGDAVLQHYTQCCSIHAVLQHTHSIAAYTQYCSIDAVLQHRCSAAAYTQYCSIHAVLQHTYVCRCIPSLIAGHSPALPSGSPHRVAVACRSTAAQMLPARYEHEFLGLKHQRVCYIF